MSRSSIELSNISYERDLYESGIMSIAGVDEVGRGALAGPLIAAAVILPPIAELDADIAFWRTVHDSKTITESRRTIISGEIINRAVDYATAAIEPDEIDELGVGPANRIAMERAVLGLDSEPDVLLIDAMTIESSTWQIGIIDGDALSLSIAAASIVAKVFRDTLMIDYAAHYPAYGFARNKGYGVPTHIAALRKHGVTPLHRTCFAPVRVAMEARHGRIES